MSNQVVHISVSALCTLVYGSFFDWLNYIGVERGPTPDFGDRRACDWEHHHSTYYLVKDERIHKYYEDGPESPESHFNRSLTCPDCLVMWDWAVEEKVRYESHNDIRTSP